MDASRPMRPARSRPVPLSWVAAGPGLDSSGCASLSSIGRAHTRALLAGCSFSAVFDRCSAVRRTAATHDAVTAPSCARSLPSVLAVVSSGAASFW